MKYLYTLLKAPRVIYASNNPSRYLVEHLYADHLSLPLGASLTVRSGEQAFMAIENRIVASFEPGIHLLNRECLADLAVLYSWPADFVGPIGGDILFTSLAEQQDLWETTISDTTFLQADVTSRNTQYESSSYTADSDNHMSTHTLKINGSLNYSVIDAGRFAFACLKHWRNEKDLATKLVKKTTIEAIQACFAQDSSAVQSLVIDNRLVSDSLQRSVRAQLEPLGIGDIRLRIRRVTDLQPPKTNDDRKAYTDSAHRVIPLPVNVAASNDSSLDSSIIQPVSSEELAIRALEEEISHLDAWGSISQSNRQPDHRQNQSTILNDNRVELSPTIEFDEVTHLDSPYPDGHQKVSDRKLIEPSVYPPGRRDIDASKINAEIAEKSLSNIHTPHDNEEPDTGYRDLDNLESDYSDLAKSSEIDELLREHFAEIEIYVALNMHQSGPYNIDAILDFIYEQTITADTLIWFQGMTDWQRAIDIAELEEKFTT